MDKSPGPDKVTARVLKDRLDLILGPLTEIMTCSILTSSFPAKWKKERGVFLNFVKHESVCGCPRFCCKYHKHNCDEK